MALKGPTPVDLPAVLLTPVEHGSQIRPEIYALHHATWHDTALVGSSTILEAATGSGSEIGKNPDERLEVSGFRRDTVLVTSVRRRKDLKEKPLGLKKNSTLIISTCRKINFAVPGLDRGSTNCFSMISYVGLISSSSNFELRHPIGRTCQRCHNNDQCSLLETRGGESLLVKSSLRKFYEFP